MTIPTGSRLPMPWNAWAPSVELPPAVRRLLRERLGLTGEDQPAVAEVDVLLPEPRLAADALAALLDVVGALGLGQSSSARLQHAAGRSTSDLVRLRAGHPRNVPDAVVWPATHEQVLAVLHVCSTHRIAVVPFGGGTSVVGGVDPDRSGLSAVVTLNLGRLDQLVSLDVEARVVRLQAGMRAPDAEAALQAEGFTLGHYPQSFEHATIGGFAATRSCGQASCGYGRFDEMVLALRAATPRGTLELGRGPASAAGPDLRQLLLGSEGAFAVITDVTLRVRPRPAASLHEAWRFRDFAAGTAAMRALAQAEALPTVTRLSDEHETALTTALASDPAADGALVEAVTIYEGSASDVQAQHSRVSAILTAAGGTSHGPGPAQAWERARFHAPYLRDAVLRAGAFAETVETAASWSALPELYRHLSNALSVPASRAPVVTCHISHMYPDGAALYFTVLAAPGDDGLTWWQARKRAASEAVMQHGGTITHHHGVGLEHREWMNQEVGDLGVEILRAIKTTLDPVGILNPGKLTPAAPGPIS